MDMQRAYYNKNDSFLRTGDGTCALPPEKRKKIFKFVAIIHFIVIGVPLLWFLFSYFFIPKKSVIKVTLVSAPQSVDFSDVPAYEPPAPTPPIKQPNKSYTPPVRKKSIKKRPPQKKKSVPKKKWKPRKKITISKQTVSNTPRPAYKPVKVKKVSADDIERRLKSSVSSSSVRRTSVSSVSGNISASYRDQISTAIYQMWQQPLRSELGGQLPVVYITITVESSGRVSSSRILTKSGVRAMDSSAASLLQQLKQLPAPPSGRMTFNFALEVQ